MPLGSERPASTAHLWELAQEEGGVQVVATSLLAVIGHTRAQGPVLCDQDESKCDLSVSLGWKV
jgi:hypothetical protein